MKILCKTVSLILLILNTLRLGALGVAEWQFLGASRLPAPDEVAGIPAAAAGDASRLALREGVQFRNRDAADDCGAYLRIADQPSLTGHDNGKNGLASLNLAVRFRPETIRHAVLLRKTDPGTDFGYQLFLTGEGKVALRIRNRDGKTVNVVSRNRVRPGEWNMADATADSARTLYNLQVRLNGVVTRASGAFTPLSDTSGALTVGGLERGPGKSGQYFDGAIASAAVSDVTRALDEPGAVDPAPADMTGTHLPGIERMEFVYQEPPTPECHAATVADLGNGELLAAWFGGTCEGHLDVGIWTARYSGGRWSRPVETVQRLYRDGVYYQLWNPLLFRHSSGKLFLFYKYGRPFEHWDCAYLTSDDGGRSWSAPHYPGGRLHGPSKNKPVELEDGTIYCPAGGDKMEYTPDLGKTWKVVRFDNPEKFRGVIQPALLRHGNGVLQALYRTMGEKHLAENWSHDNGRSWSALKMISLPSNNSGFDAVELKDGRFLLVYNHAETPDGRWGGKRTPLNVAVSSDGKEWKPALILEDGPGEYSYPSVIQAEDGKIHVICTWNRVRIKHVVLDPAALER